MCLSAVLGAFAGLTFAAAPRGRRAPESDSPELIAAQELEGVERLIATRAYYQSGAAQIGKLPYSRFP
ncbi:hypothetical protein ACGFJ7_13555 [Actinoplanes sp. NPDC048988]|uniref:hypothetical protein n=1 Tax=Actinoplanes sp. NPDC048988 TaxID=3363901 RepID=UPI0037245BB9